MERLQDRIEAINSRHKRSLGELLALQANLEQWPGYSQLSALTRIEVLGEIFVSSGPNPKLEKVFIVHPKLIETDEEISTLCECVYLRPDGRLLPCGGVRHKRSACPPFAPTAEETRKTLNGASAMALFKTADFTEYQRQKDLHRTLLTIEEYLQNNGFEIVGSWSAGPCRVCEPENECLGEGKCRQSKLRRFSLEGSGMAVFLTCARIADITGDNSWQLELIENWGLESQSREAFPSVIAVAVK